VFTIVFCFFGWTLGWILFGRTKAVRQLAGASIATHSEEVLSTPNALGNAAHGRPFDVIIPARNEADSIGLLLSDLAALPSAGNRVVVVNDHSTDRTAHIASEFAGVEVIDAADLPEGWTGKSWACHSGVEHLRNSSTDTDRGLIFFDADVRVEQTVAQLLVDYQKASGALVSVQPWHETKRPYEKLSALFNVIALMGTAMASRTKSRGAFGPVLVTSDENYLLAGGHEAVRNEVVEDLALAANYRRSGQPVELFRGAELVKFRMYPNGLRQLCEGWAKNFATGAGATHPLRLLAAVLWLTSLGSATGLALEAAIGSQPLWLALVVYFAFTAQLVWMFHHVGNFGFRTAVAFPVLLAFFFCIFGWSLWRTYVRRSVTWRGRAIPLGTQSHKPC
jgi:4,4'-diaponeurosporenoate glycosyltransferase